METLPEVLEEVCIGDHFRLSANTGHSNFTDHRLFIHEFDFRYWTEGGGGMRTPQKKIVVEEEDDMDFEESKSGKDKGEFKRPHTIATISIADSSDIPESMSKSQHSRVME